MHLKTLLQKTLYLDSVHSSKQHQILCNYCVLGTKLNTGETEMNTIGPPPRTLPSSYRETLLTTSHQDPLTTSLPQSVGILTEEGLQPDPKEAYLLTEYSYASQVTTH